MHQLAHSRSKALLAVLLLALPAFAGAEGRRDNDRQDAIAEDLGQDALETLRPAYNLVEGLSDGIFDLVRYNVLNPLFRGGARQAQKYSQADTYTTFKGKLRQKELRFLKRLSENLAASNPAWARNEQTSLVLDSLKDAMIDRYQVKQLGLWAKSYANAPENWDPASISMAGVVGGAFLYLNGAHTQASLGKLNIHFDLRSAMRLRRALKESASLPRAASLEIGVADKPFAFTADWGVDHGALRAETFGLKYHAQF